MGKERVEPSCLNSSSKFRDVRSDAPPPPPNLKNPLTIEGIDSLPGGYMDTQENVLAVSAALDRRVQNWIEPGFQKRYAALLVSVVLLVSCILVATFWFHSEQILQTLQSAGVLKQHSLHVLIETQMKSLIWSVVAVSGLFSAFVLLIARFLSHRIVGPIFAIKRSLECISRGDMEGARLKLRTDDEFRDVEALMNQVVDRLSNK